MDAERAQEGSAVDGSLPSFTAERTQRPRRGAKERWQAFGGAVNYAASNPPIPSAWTPVHRYAGGHPGPCPCYLRRVRLVWPGHLSSERPCQRADPWIAQRPNMAVRTYFPAARLHSVPVGLFSAPRV